MNDNTKPIILESASLSTRIGFSGDPLPKYIIPTIVGKPKYFVNPSDVGLQEYYVGNSALKKSHLLHLTYPVECGLISNFDCIELLWNYIFLNELYISPQDYPIVMTETPMNPKFNREKTTQIMFETFKTPLFYINPQPIFSLYSAGKTTGIVLDIGESFSRCTPVYEGSILPQGSIKIDISGKDITNYLQKELIQKYSNYEILNNVNVIQIVKENICNVCCDETCYNNLLHCNVDDILYTLPDGKSIGVGIERFKCPEVLFKPFLMNSEQWGCHEVINSSITKCYKEIQDELYKNIVLSGGSTMFSGITQRFEKELSHLEPLKDIKVIEQNNRNISSWIGASIFSSLPSFNTLCLSIDQYEEYGPSLVNRICTY